MESLVRAFEAAFGAVPLPLLQLWGGFAYLVGLVLMVLAFGGFTLRPGGRWGLGRERQSWNAQALASSLLTFVLVLATGYLGSFVVLVPGAQTLESLKDLTVFLCVVLFGYPALLVVPFAYGLSDLAEGVPPAFLMDWLPGYFINPACFWLAHQLIGRHPDFRRAATWRAYLLFVAAFMAIEPVLWGHICAGKFTPAISYGQITPALAFTTTITWALAPFAMLAALPLARRAGLYWAELPGHVRHRLLGSRTWIWQSGRQQAAGDVTPLGHSVPIHLAISAPTIALVLVMVGLTAYLTQRSAEADAHKLAVRLHEEMAENIQLRLAAHLARAASQGAAAADVGRLLRDLRIAGQGRAYVVDGAGQLIASSSGGAPAADPVLAAALLRLQQAGLSGAGEGRAFTFDVLTAKPVARDTWLARASFYRDHPGSTAPWLLLTVLPESYHLAGVREGHAESAKVLAAALALSLALAALLATLVTAPLVRISRATQALAGGGALDQPLPGSRLQELDVLSASFNDMARQLRERTERLHLATSVASLGVWDWDVVRDRLIWDEAMLQQYGLARSDFDGSYAAWLRMLAPEGRDQADAAVRAALRGEGELDFVFRIARPDRSVRVLRGLARTLRDAEGRPLRMVGVNYDITERQRAEEELLRHRHHLEQLVAERTEALSVAAAEAEAATRAKSDFLANMSHEIRTPMNAVIGMTDLALRADPAPRQRGYLERTRTAAMSLLAILNDILDFSKIEAGKLELTRGEFTLHEVFDRVAALVAPRAQQRGVELLLNLGADTPACVVGDALRLEQVLVNLATNAVKFTEEGEVVITVHPLAVGDGGTTLRFAVQDTGVGIEPELQARLFQPFSQVDASAARRHGGTGLGLAISKQLVELMGGTIGVDSTPGQGSVFWFTLPFDPAASGVAAPPPLASRPLHVLVVDDSAMAREVLRDLLLGLGCRPTLAAGGEQALAELHRAGPPFDLMLLDWKMPGLDGAEVVKRLRADTRLKTPPKIVMISAWGDDALARWAQQQQLQGCLAKPVTVAALNDAIVTALGLPAPATGPAQAPAAAPPQLRGRRVLLVEDNEFNQIVAGELLRDVAGMQVTIAGNGREALARLREKGVDAVLMDLQMPLLDGYQTTRLLRADPALAALPIIAMTAHTMVGERQKCLDAGMNDHVGKPFEPQLLFDTLARWIDGAGAVAQAPFVPERPAPVDFTLGLRHCAGRVHLYEMAVHNFLQSEEAQPALLEDALREGDLDRVRRLTHGLISSAGMLGAQLLSEAARALHDAIGLGKPDGLPELMDVLRTEHRRVVDVLQARAAGAAASLAHAGAG